MYRILVSETFQQQYQKLSQQNQKRIKKGLEALQEDPYKPRAKADIKQLTDTKPVKHRLRIGDYRIIYYIDKKTVKLIELFHRGRGYKQ